MNPQPKRQYRKRSILERLMSGVKINPVTQCWEWQRGLNHKGYGIFAVDGHPKKAHRVSFKEFNGEIPENTLVCHTCDNRNCINPTHLFLGSHADNVHDMMRKGRHHCGAVWRLS